MRAQTHPSRRARAGYTLIELLVVIAIIAVLVALVTAGVMKAIGQGPQAQARHDIGTMATAIGSFKTELNLNYVPSYIVLREDNNYAASSDPRAKLTPGILQTMFGRRINLAPISGTPAAGAFPDWNGDGKFTAGDIVLQGHHCLVFFLGGIPSAPGATPTCLGFSRDPSNPTLPPTPGGSRYGPYFDGFKSNRLLRDSNGMFVYADPFLTNMPYAYFSSRKGNDYNAADCAALGIAPYSDPSGRFINPNGFQIISAGSDGLFGPGGGWDPIKGGGTSATQADNLKTADNLTNFSQYVLKAPQG